jgi:hypothetical protein
LSWSFSPHGDLMGRLNQTRVTYLVAVGITTCGIFLVAGFAPEAEAHKAADPQATILHLDGSFPEALGYVGGARELSNGNLLVADPLGQILAIVDLESGTADTLGRVGAGPAEYRYPDALYPLAADSSLLVDLGNARLLLLGPSGEFVSTLSMTRVGDGGALTIILPRFVDAAGRLYYQPEHFSTGSGPDSAFIVRFDRTDGRIDTLCAIGLPRADRDQASGRVILSRRALLRQDDWAVSADGRIAIVHSADYSIEWIQTNGTRVRGPANDYPAVRVSRSEKESWLDEFFGERVSVRTRRTADGTRSMQLLRGSSGPRPDIDSYEWPDRMPAFRAGRTIAAPDGRLWVERYVSADARPIVDVFDARGHKQEEITLPHGRRVVAFGANHVYLVRKDELDLQWLERYRITVTGPR